MRVRSFLVGRRVDRDPRPRARAFAVSRKDNLDDRIVDEDNAVLADAECPAADPKVRF